MRLSKKILPSVLFGVLLFGLAFYTELYFHISGDDHQADVKVNQPFHLILDLNFEQIDLDYKSNTYVFNFVQGSWYSHLQKEGPPLEIRGDFIKKMINAMASIQVTRELNNDDATRTNFLLDRPWMKIKLATARGEQILLAFGLNNPVNRTSYMLYNNSLYEIESLPSFLIDLNSNDFISRNPFAAPWSGIKKWKVATNSPDRILNTFDYKDGQWYTPAGVQLNHSKVEEYLSILSTKQAVLILDKPEPFITQIIESEMNRPAYIISFEDSEKINHEFYLSRAVSNIPSSNGNLNQVYILKRKTTQFSWVVDKDFFQALVKEEKFLK